MLVLSETAAWLITLAILPPNLVLCSISKLDSAKHKDALAD